MRRVRAVSLGRHALRFLPYEPLLIYIRFDGDLETDEARALTATIAGELAGRCGRFVVDASRLGACGPDSRRELLAQAPDPRARGGQILDFLLVGASLRQKLLLMQLMSLIGLPPESPGQTLFFDALDDALLWLCLPPEILGDPDGAAG
ncbi:MAG: hypothetical protein U1A78_25425 [Polyangia bacterium]